MEEKEFIRYLYENRTKDGEISGMLTRALNIFTKTVFGDDNRFIFELLQNADDSPKEKGIRNIEVEIKLSDEYLIFSHSGKHFSKEDIIGICDIGKEDSYKTIDIEKTGYKGIGFKSVFRVSDKVYILSDKFSFKFDKKHFEEKYSTKYPWQVIPIWVEKSEIPIEVLLNLTEDNVTTIIYIKDKKKIRNEINEVFADPKIMLFLRHIKSVTFFDNNIQIFKINRNEKCENLKQIYVNDSLKSSWLYKEFTFPIDRDVIEKLKEYDSAECPDKLKKATITKITFAALIENSEIKELSNSLIFNYLPTKVNCNFNFIVNGDFLLNAERTQILENEWNGFLFKQIAICKISWLAELAQQDKFKYQFTKLINNKLSVIGSSIFKKSFNDGLNKALSEIPFIPQQDNNKNYLRVDECILDLTGFSEKFGTEILTNYYNNNYKVADCKILNPSKLVYLGSKENDIKTLCEIFSTDLFLCKYKCNIEFNFKLIEFLYIKDSSSNLKWSQYLKTANFLIDDNFYLNSPENIYLPLLKKDYEIKNIIALKFINSELYQIIKNNKNLLDWLELLGVRRPSEVEIFRKSIINMIEKDLVNSTNALQIGRFIFEVFKKGEFTYKDYEILHELKLITNLQTIESAKDCYLSDYYEPQLKIQNIFLKGKYVSDEYVENNSEIMHWKDFFIKIGVKEKIKIKIKTQIERLALVDKYPSFNSYLNYIDENNYYPSQTKRFMWQHGLKNVVIIDFLEYLSDYNFSKSFWNVAIKNNWNNIYSNCQNSIYYTWIGDVNIISYFEYYTKNNLCIPGNDGKCYKSINLYSNKLKNIVGDYYKFVDDGINFDKEQEEFLGIKTIIPIEECFNILKSLEKEDLNNNIIKKVTNIYKYLIKCELNNDVLNNISGIRPEKLLACNGTFQERDSLYCFNIKELLTPSDSCNFIKVQESIKGEELENLCLILGIPIIRYEDLEPRYSNIEEEYSLSRLLIDKSKYIASIVCNINLEDQKIVLVNIIQKIKKSFFYKAESLSLVLHRNGKEIYKHDIGSGFISNISSIYYVGSWENPLTLYSLSSSLCSLFELDSMEREISLLLQLSDNDTKAWLNSNGYEILDISIDEILSSIGDQEINLKDIEVEDIRLFNDNNEETYEINELYSNTETSESIVDEDDNDESQEYLSNSNNTNNFKFNSSKNEPKISISEEDKNNAELTDYKNSIKNSTNVNFSRLQENKKRYRLVSYVSNRYSDDWVDTKHNEVKFKDFEIETKAKKAVINYEKEAGRIPTEMSDLQEGFNIKSCDKESGKVERYIQVKGLIGEWSTYNVALLSTEQLNKAKEEENNYWLYVVEFVESENNSRIYRIQNPFYKITKYAFDLGWKDISEKENPIDKFVTDVKIEHNIYGYGTIKEVIKKGNLKLLIVEFEGKERKIPINMTQIKIVEGE
ncbi:DUF3883 domain-containing protein [Clostridium botulinum]|nr:DUF3883 domain-containing protein [Clostridium botulinum]